MTKRKTFLLRLSPELYAALEAWAQQEMRSVNSQMEYILREAVRRRQRNLDIPLSSDSSVSLASDASESAHSAEPFSASSSDKTPGGEKEADSAASSC
ncbi:MAG TPA: hypothetical protein PK777_09210 [Thermoguttaceae bacterium]|nr:hypothetical protein [Thermoguttaceae bacterium]HPP53115.1 hypothetical protein [Thermoguttaceae bacterium]